MFDLLTKLRNVAANWKELAFYLIKQDESSLRGKLLLAVKTLIYLIQLSILIL